MAPEKYLWFENSNFSDVVKYTALNRICGQVADHRLRNKTIII